MKSKIVLAVNMLHYLPLYIAYDRFLKDDFDLTLAPKPYGDREAIKILMSNLENHRSTDFCVCDPMMVDLASTYSANTNEWPIVIAQILQKIPFWAVNHQSNGFKDFKGFKRFNQLFGYPKPNTGYVLAKLICDQANAINDDITLELREKKIGAELDMCLSSENSVVLEADILKIRKYQEQTDKKIVFSFPNHKQYQNFCFTALLARDKFLKTENGKLKAFRLIEAIGKSIYLINHDDLIRHEYACKIFKKDGYDENVIIGSIDELRDSNIFSKSLFVTKSGWRNSMKVRKKVDHNFKFQSYYNFVNNKFVEKVYKKRFRDQFDERGPTIIRDFRDIPSIRTFIEIIIAILILTYPIFIIKYNNQLSHLENYLLPFILHFILNILLLLSYFYRDRILFRLLKIDSVDYLLSIAGIFFTVEMPLFFEFVK